MAHSTHAVEDVLDKTEELLDGEKDYLHVSELTEELGLKSIAAVLVAPSLAVVSPLSGVPLFSSACGMMIALVSGQMLMGRENLWLPDFLSRRAVSASAAHKATQALRRVASWMDRLFKKRFQPLLSPPFVRLIQAICMLCGLVMPFLEVLPFTSSILGAVVALLAVSMLTGDGLIALVTVSFLVLGVGGVAFHFW
ncbi:exopolysaccharide biosynthesis protein [Phaeobacter sp. B1627]|uniref:exopolysaccharide biosynthesis protein n=1 Tax=Phaeobacter sp. B1627 TaxID=2583809 RepID=UPI001117EFED|nr:exopolysaccharide biosynthesis protein [Phaeobacter sp. B1627]TNJ47473.1 exopolysaccharide biosynthesis protein [Phaeobacter sp. B1627]